MNRNPCLTSGPKNTPCPYAGEEKNDPVCLDCNKKYEYAKRNSCPCSTQDHQSLGYGGFSLEDLKKNHKPKHNISDPLIEKMCQEAGITVEELRRKGRKIRIRNVRRDIAIVLHSQGMTVNEIGPLIGVGYGSVENYLKPLPK